MTDSESDSASERPKLYLFGRNVAEIPCYRDSLLNGIFAGIGGGLLYFLFTSNVRVASNVAVGTFTATSLGYWIHCRYKYTKIKFEMQQIAAGLKQKTMYEGTALEREVVKKLEQEGVDVKSV